MVNNIQEEMTGPNSLFSNSTHKGVHHFFLIYKNGK